MSMKKAYSYVRFSTKAQSEGASLNRQLELCRTYARSHNLILDDKSYRDLGVSAYKGVNAVDGNLGLFIQAVEEGKIPRGSYLLVESLDRLSRNVILEAQALFNKILSLDITIVTLLDNQEFSKERVNEDGGLSIMISIMYMLRAHDESKKKSQRVKDGWENARQTKKIITKVIPSWLKIVDDKFEVIEEKAQVIRRIFQLSFEGNGTPRIAKILNDEGIKTLGPAAEWSSGLVVNQLNAVATYGAYETAKVPLRENYFPAIISKEAFYSAKQLTKSRNRAPGPREQGIVANLFAGRSYCGLCGSRMKTGSVAKTRFSENPDGDRHYLICVEHYEVKRCKDAKRVPYAQFENELLEVLITKQKRSVFSFGSETRYDPRPAISAEISAMELGIEKHLDFMLSMPNSLALLQRLSKMEKDLAELKLKLANAVPMVTTPELIEGLHETYDRFKELKLTKAPEYKAMRQELQAGLRRVVKRIDFHHKPPEGDINFYRITFQSGTVREWYYTNTALVG